MVRAAFLLLGSGEDEAAESLSGRGESLRGGDARVDDAREGDARVDDAREGLRCGPVEGAEGRGVETKMAAPSCRLAPPLLFAEANGAFGPRVSLRYFAAGISPLASSMVKRWLAGTLLKLCFVPLGHSTCTVLTTVSAPSPKVSARSLCDA